ncbi:MAG: hypothetical protein HPY50_19955 [Firmicutes bacterium]|nr:hypothetical protein [Bacillota bacterium]
MSKPITRLNRFISLVRVLLLSSLGLSAFRARGRKNPREYLKGLAILAVVVVGFSPTLLLYCQLLWTGYDALAGIGQEGAILMLGIVVVSATVFFFGLFYVINTFYFAKDVEALLSLPLRGWEVLGARFIVVLCFEYLTALPFLLPPLLIFGIKSGAPVLYWLYSLLGFLLAPVAPLALASLLTMVVMRVSNLSRRRDLIRILGAVAAIALAVGLQFLFQKSGPNLSDPQYLQSLLADPEGLVNLGSRAFPFTQFLARGLMYSGALAGLVNLLYYTGVSLLAVLLTWGFAEKLYFPGITGTGEAPARRRVFDRAQYLRRVKTSSPIYSFFLKEMRIMLRTPVYFINCILPVLFVPVLLLVPMLLQVKNEAGPPPWANISQDPYASMIVLLVLSGISLFLSVTDSITPTALSREGPQFFVSKYIPLPYRRQILAKLLSGYLVGVVGSVILTVAAGVFMHLELYLVSLTLAVTLVAIVPLAEIGLLIDIYRPKLDWDNEQTAVKRNLNIVLAMMASILVGGAVALAVFLTCGTPVEAALLMLTVYGLLGVFGYYLLMTRGVRRYEELEG